MNMKGEIINLIQINENEYRAESLANRTEPRIGTCLSKTKVEVFMKQVKMFNLKANIKGVKQ